MIPVFRPLIENEELNAANEALKMGWLGMGSYVSEFEQEIKSYIKTDDRYVVAVSTGHAAIHIALIISGVKEGDEVITPSFNNIADFQAILAVGAEPVFCDINEETLCIDLEKAEKLITKKTKAMIVMDYDCLLCDHDKVAEIAKKYNIRIIHDACHSFGSSYNGKKVGSFSDICIFSFDPVKTITCIDGGAIVVRTEKEFKDIHEIRLIGMGQPASLMYQNQRAWTYDVKQLGYRYHMANLHAAMGLAQMKKIEVISDTRNEAAKKYNRELGGVKGIITPKSDFQEITPFLYYIRVLNNKRDDLIKYLKSKDIDTGIHWRPAHWFSLFQNTKRGDLSVTERIGNEILSLPLHSKMEAAHQDKVISEIKTYFA